MDTPESIARVFERILDTKRVPIDAEFDVVPVVSNGTFSDGWSIRMKLDGGALSHAFVIEK